MKAAIYVRVSTNHQIDKDSLPLQKKDMINYSKYVLNINEYEIFEDAGLSAKNTDRPAFKDMINRIKNKEFTHVLVWKIDRISRNLLDFCDMYNLFKKHNVNFISKNEQFDTSSAMGEAMLKIILVFAELERKLTAERVKATMLSRAEQGKWNGAPVPLGYKWDDNIKFPVVDSEEAKTINLIYNMYLECRTTTKIMRYLNINNIKTKKDGTWTTKTITDIIRNPFYTGTYRYNYRESARGSKKEEKEWILLENNHAAIIDKEVWNKCNKIMDLNSCHNNAAAFNPKGYVHIFSSLLKCFYCNSTMYSSLDKARNDGFRPSLYYCSGKYKMSDNCLQKTISEKYIFEFIFNFLRNINLNLESNIEVFRENINNNLNVYVYNTLDLYNVIKESKNNNIYFTLENEKKASYYIDNYKDKKVKYEKALKKLYDLYIFDDEMSEKDYVLKKNELEKKISEIDKLESNIIIESSSSKKDKISYIAINKLITSSDIDINYKDIITTLDKKVIKSFINSFIDSIYIKDKIIENINFRNGFTVVFKSSLL